MTFHYTPGKYIIYYNIERKIFKNDSQLSLYYTKF